jgi:hypothetical protein
MKMTKTQRAAIIQMIDGNTKYDASTVRISRNGEISAVLDADKTSHGPETARLLVGHVADFANGADPFRA